MLVDSGHIAILMRSILGLLRFNRVIIHNALWVDAEDTKENDLSAAPIHTNSNLRPALKVLLKTDFPVPGKRWTVSRACGEGHAITRLISTIPYQLHCLSLITRTKTSQALCGTSIWKTAMETSLIIMRDVSSVLLYKDIEDKSVLRSFWFSTSEVLTRYADYGRSENLQQISESRDLQAQSFSLEVLALEYLVNFWISDAHSCPRKLLPELISILDAYASLGHEGEGKTSIAKSATGVMLDMCNTIADDLSISATVLPIVLTRVRNIIHDYIEEERHSGQRPPDAARSDELSFVLERLRVLSVFPPKGEDPNEAVILAGPIYHLVRLFPQLLECIEVRDRSIRIQLKTLLSRVGEVYK
eukprot:GHVO01041135.1.p1 GENE.GHVO01041135.1~~GHVO01041135.1.p1  ORF type:complete len:391 (-),score=38.42 GHVO01041135.1:104-1180(-)